MTEKKNDRPPKKINTEEKYRAPALDKGLDILELLALQPRGLTRSEIVKAMGRKPGEVYRMIERLVARQYISRSPEGDRYALTMKLFLLGSTHPPLRRLTSQAQPLLDIFARNTEQSVHLAALEHTSVIVLAQANNPANWEFRLKVGAVLDLINTGSGKTLLAFQDHDRCKDLVSLVIENTNQQINEKQFFNELASIKKDGFRIADSGQLLGVTDISVPVLNDKSSAFGVITCPHIKRLDQANNRHKIPSIDEIRKLLVELAENISISPKSHTRDNHAQDLLT